MKFKASVKDLTNSLKKVLPFTSNDRTFENILLEINENELTIKAINNTSNAVIKSNIESSSVFGFVVNGSRFLNLISTFNEFVNIELKDTNIVISENKSKIVLNVMDVKNFPDNAKNIDTDSFEIDSFLMIKGIENAINFTDTKSMSLTSGINIDFKSNILTILGTDGACASITEIETQFDINKNVTIPFNIAKELIKDTGTKIKISLTDKHIKFDYDNFVIVSNILNGDYPNVKELIPKDYTNILKCKKSIIENILKRVELLNTKSQATILLMIRKNQLELSYTNNDNNSLNEIIDIDYIVEDLDIKCNYKYLSNIIKNFDDILTVKLGNETSPLILFENNGNTMLLARLQ